MKVDMPLNKETKQTLITFLYFGELVSSGYVTRGL